MDKREGYRRKVSREEFGLERDERQRRGERDQTAGNREERMEGGRRMVQSADWSISWFLQPERILLAALVHRTIKAELAPVS